MHRASLLGAAQWIVLHTHIGLRHCGQSWGESCGGTQYKHSARDPTVTKTNLKLWRMPVKKSTKSSAKCKPKGASRKKSGEEAPAPHQLESRQPSEDCPQEAEDPQYPQDPQDNHSEHKNQESYPLLWSKCLQNSMRSTPCSTTNPGQISRTRRNRQGYFRNWPPSWSWLVSTECYFSHSSPLPLSFSGLPSFYNVPHNVSTDWTLFHWEFHVFFVATGVNIDWACHAQSNFCIHVNSVDLSSYLFTRMNASFEAQL